MSTADDDAHPEEPRPRAIVLDEYALELKRPHELTLWETLAACIAINTLKLETLGWTNRLSLTIDVCETFVADDDVDRELLEQLPATDVVEIFRVVADSYDSSEYR